MIRRRSRSVPSLIRLYCIISCFEHRIRIYTSWYFQSRMPLKLMTKVFLRLLNYFAMPVQAVHWPGLCQLEIFKSPKGTGLGTRARLGSKPGGSPNRCSQTVCKRWMSEWRKKWPWVQHWWGKWFRLEMLGLSWPLCHIRIFFCLVLECSRGKRTAARLLLVNVGHPVTEKIWDMRRLRSDRFRTAVLFSSLNFVKARVRIMALSENSFILFLCGRQFQSISIMVLVQIGMFRFQIDPVCEKFEPWALLKSFQYWNSGIERCCPTEVLCLYPSVVVIIRCLLGAFADRSATRCDQSWRAFAPADSSIKEWMNRCSIGCQSVFRQKVLAAELFSPGRPAQAFSLCSGKNPISPRNKGKARNGCVVIPSHGIEMVHPFRSHL